MNKEAYGEVAMGTQDVFKWHKLFRERRERVENDDRRDIAAGNLGMRRMWTKLVSEE